jgi:peptidyl-tRNA hydrolase
VPEQAKNVCSLFMIVDSGKTEFGGVSTTTCCAIGPNEAEAIDQITGPNGVFPLKLR